MEKVLEINIKKSVDILRIYKSKIIKLNLFIIHNINLNNSYYLIILNKYYNIKNDYILVINYNNNNDLQKLENDYYILDLIY